MKERLTRRGETENAGSRASLSNWLMISIESQSRVIRWQTTKSHVRVSLRNHLVRKSFHWEKIWKVQRRRCRKEFLPMTEPPPSCLPSFLLPSTATS